MHLAWRRFGAAARDADDQAVATTRWRWERNAPAISTSSPDPVARSTTSASSPHHPPTTGNGGCCTPATGSGGSSRSHCRPTGSPRWWARTGLTGRARRAPGR
ncbi:hypothetical protein NKG94_48370 [Micromonospora sp. M12]